MLENVSFDTVTCMVVVQDDDNNTVRNPGDVRLCDERMTAADADVTTPDDMFLVRTSAGLDCVVLATVESALSYSDVMRLRGATAFSGRRGAFLAGRGGGDVESVMSPPAVTRLCRSMSLVNRSILAVRS